MENKRLLRSNNRMLAGVCAGIAEYFGWEVSTVRIVYALATIFTAFSGGIIYLILWIVMPERQPLTPNRVRQYSATLLQILK